MSGGLLRYFSPVGKTLKRKDEPDEDPPERPPKKDKKYDASNRERRFLPSWQIGRPWLKYDEVKNVMFCQVCRDYPLLADKTSALSKGTNNFRIDPIKIHESGTTHSNVMKHDMKAKAGPKTSAATSRTPIGQAFLKLDKNQRERYRMLFNTAYTVGKNGKPFSDFVWVSELQNKNFENSLGKNYMNSKGCAMFIKAIREGMKDELKETLKSVDFCSILSDGSTDSGILEQEIVYLRYVDPLSCDPVTKMIDIVQLESGKAEGIFNGIKTALSSINLDMKQLLNPGFTNGGPKLVCCNFDGASVMAGKKGGVISYIRKEAEFPVLYMHCIAHRLELAVLDSNKECKLMVSFEDTLKGIFNFYHFSPKKRRELNEISQFYENELVHFSSVKQVRWLSSKSRAVAALRVNLPSVCKHLEHEYVAGNASHDSDRALGYHHQITSPKFLKHLYFLSDFLPLIKDLSLKFQKKDILIIDLPDQIQTCLSHLELLKNHPGKNMRQFLEMYKPGEKSFGVSDDDSNVIKMTLPRNNSKCPEIDFVNDPDVTNLIDGTITYVKKRFQQLFDEPLSSLNVMNFQKWPTDSLELASYGNEEIIQFISEFKSYFPQTDSDQITHEWLFLKEFLKSMRTEPLLDMYTYFLRLQTKGSMSEPLPIMVKLINLILTISPTTAACERGFSHMKYLKHSLRTQLTEENLSNQLFVMQEGPSLEKFNPDGSIDQWLISGKGEKHVKGHKLPGTRQNKPA